MRPGEGNVGITYTEGYKYRLERSHISFTGIKGHAASVDGWLSLDKAGVLWIREGYCWDGPSGPSVDTKSFMRASLVHDALYQLMREGHLPLHLRGAADDLLQQHCREDGMSWLRSWYVRKAVGWFGESSAEPQQRRVLSAP